jgi:hypothetical protein
MPGFFMFRIQLVTGCRAHFITERHYGGSGKIDARVPATSQLFSSQASTNGVFGEFGNAVYVEFFHNSFAVRLNSFSA